MEQVCTRLKVLRVWTFSLQKSLRTIRTLTFMITENIHLTQDHLLTLQGFLCVINHTVIHHLSHGDDTAAPV